MPRALSLWLPLLPIDVHHRRRRRQEGQESQQGNGTPKRDEIVLLTKTIAQRVIVVHASPSATEAGIRPGMALSEARAAISSERLTVETHHPRRTQAALRAIALWCHRFSPIVAEEDEQGICMDITGCAHLFGGEQLMLEAIEGGLKRLGLHCRTAIAPTHAAARSLARWGERERSIVDTRSLRMSVEPLPVEALGLEATSIASLGEVNIRTIGQLAALPRPAVASRFDSELLKALDRLFGRAMEFIEPLRPADPPKAERTFEGPCCDLEALSIACRGLIEELCEQLKPIGRGLREWTVIMDRSDLLALTIRLRHAVPSRDPRHLWKLLEPRLEKAHLGFGIDAIAITAIQTRRVAQDQRGMWSGTGEDDQEGDAAGQLLDTFVNQFGPDRVLRAKLVESHLPEDAWELGSVLDLPAGSADARLAKGDRPTRLYERPMPVNVIAMSPDGPVRQLQWGKQIHRLTASIGPERLHGCWWEGQRVIRDYFKVQNEEGLWLWIFRDCLETRWYIHGLWE